jgi:Domain of unknown function (DUF5680)
MVDVTELRSFVVRAKRATYVGSGSAAESSRSGSHDLAYTEGLYSYRDSYFGGVDFLGQEIVWHNGIPTWAMNYYGYIVRADLIDAARAGLILKAALSQPTAEGRLLENLAFDGFGGRYEIRSEGSITGFKGRETICIEATLAYALDYHGGLIKH